MPQNQDFIIANIDIFKTLSNENRVNILFALYEGDRLWDYLVYDLRINPKLVRDHTFHLIERGYITKNRGKGFTLTDLGRSLCELEFLRSLGKAIAK